MSNIKALIENSFEELGVIYDSSILDKCVELCVEYGVDNADMLVDSWMAFSVTHLHGESPTPQHLARFERETLARMAKDLNKSNDLARRGLAEPEVQSPYRPSSEAEIRTPDIVRSRIRSPRSVFSPASFSPVTDNSSSKYTSRKNAGAILCEKTASGPEEELLKGSITVKRKSPQLVSRGEFMAFNLTDCAEAAETHMSAIITQIVNKFSLDELLPVRSKQPTEYLTAGRVCCDADGKLNAESLLLEASYEAGGEIVRLDLNTIPSYSLFPGQVIAVQGLNLTGNKMMAKQVWCDGSVTSPPSQVTLPGALKAIIASGPLTTSDSLSYDTLKDLMDVVVKEKPHLLIITGPLVDSQHVTTTSPVLQDSLQAMYDRIIAQIMDPVTKLETEVVLVSSHRESHGPALFPTLPLMSSLNHPQLTILPDPSVISIDGLTIAVTSMDVLMHMGKEELAFPPHSGDRLARLASHVFQQQSFYPLRPPCFGLPLDPSLEKHLSLDINPHVLILPSDLRCFIKDVNGCTVVNPEHLAKGVLGGSYAKLLVSTKAEISGQVIKI